MAINLATREFLYVIKLMLAAVVRSDAAIPTDLGHRLMRWAGAYVGHPDHPAICSLVARAISIGRPAIYHDRPLGTRSPVQRHRNQAMKATLTGIRASTDCRRPQGSRTAGSGRQYSQSCVTVARLITASARTLAASLGVIGLSTCLAVPASAAPADDPCQGAMVLFCRLLPIAPELEGDVDLTKQMPASDPAALLPDSLPPADICANGCV